MDYAPTAGAIRYDGGMTGNAPRSGGLGEAIGGVVGITLGAAIGVVSFRCCATFDAVAEIAAIVASIIAGFALMIGGAILGNSIRF